MDLGAYHVQTYQFYPILMLSSATTKTWFIKLGHHSFPKDPSISPVTDDWTSPSYKEPLLSQVKLKILQLSERFQNIPTVNRRSFLIQNWNVADEADLKRSRYIFQTHVSMRTYFATLGLAISSQRTSSWIWKPRRGGFSQVKLGVCGLKVLWLWMEEMVYPIIIT